MIFWYVKKLIIKFVLTAKTNGLIIQNISRVTNCYLPPKLTASLFKTSRGWECRDAQWNHSEKFLNRKTNSFKLKPQPSSWNDTLVPKIYFIARMTKKLSTKNPREHASIYKDSDDFSAVNIARILGVI